MRVPDRLRLPLRFDANALAADVTALDLEDWVPHFNTSYYEGDWSGASLRSVGGVASQLYPDPAATDPYADTELLGRCPAVRHALDRLECDKSSVRLLRLGPGARVREHRDYKLGYDDGEVRLHVPLTSGSGVEFVLSGTPIEMAPGECWYVDVNCLHRVANLGASERVHLVVDCLVNPWIDATFAKADTPAVRGSSIE